MESLVTTVEDQIDRAKVRAVHLQVGELTCVVPDALHFCFEVCARGTRLEGAELAIHRIPARVRCRTCGSDAAADRFCAMCACGSVDVEVLAGRELRVRDVEVDEVA